MVIRKAIAFLTVFLLLGAICGCKKKTLTIYDYEDNIYAVLTTLQPPKNKDFAYTDIVLTEALDILMQKSNLDKDTAQKQLVNNNYKIYTFCKPELINNLKAAYEECSKGVDFGASIVDLKGNLIGMYSNSNKINFSAQKSPPYSTIKPLSVYSPAIENKVINCSSVINDSPFKKISEGNGKERDWPSNATNTYSLKPVTIYDAIKESLNTVAVKALNEYGVKNSIEFLTKNFGFDLKTEEYKANILGEDEVIGNIALGYTVGGESSIDMAGYYQIFANGGTYTAPSAIRKITDETGKVIYENKNSPKRVISEETSYIMNELLQGVISTGGTGEKAFCNNVAVAGKTGTGDANSGNWFVGVTPEYSCAVWHSSCDRNYAPEIFSSIVKLSDIKIQKFRTSPNVQKKIYCKESGKLFSSKCSQVEVGYYTYDNIPDVCDKH